MGRGWEMLVSTRVSKPCFRELQAPWLCLPPVLSMITVLQSCQDENPKSIFKCPWLLPALQPALIMLVRAGHQIPPGVLPPAQSPDVLKQRPTVQGSAWTPQWEWRSQALHSRSPTLHLWHSTQLSSPVRPSADMRKETFMHWFKTNQKKKKKIPSF